MSAAEPLIAEPPKRILLVRLSAIGDIVFATPLIHALRRAYPQAHIAWLVQPEYRDLLEHNTELDAVIECPLADWRKLWREGRFGDFWRRLMAMQDRLHAEQFDLAIDLQGLLKSGVLTWFTGARVRIGLGSREGSEWLMTRFVRRGGKPDEISSEYRYLAELLRLPVDDFAMQVAVSEEAADFAARQIKQHELEEGYVVLCSFTTRPQKHWPKRYWIQVMKRAKKRLGLTPVLLGGPDDQEAAAQLVDYCPKPVVNLVGKTTLSKAVALIDQAALVIAVDTGLGHIGIARERPSLLIFGSTCPYRETGREDARVLYNPRPCSPCKRTPSCRGRFDCMREIGPKEVLEQAQALLPVAEPPEDEEAQSTEDTPGA